MIKFLHRGLSLPVRQVPADVAQLDQPHLPAQDTQVARRILRLQKRLDRCLVNREGDGRFSLIDQPHVFQPSFARPRESAAAGPAADDDFDFEVIGMLGANRGLPHL